MMAEYEGIAYTDGHPVVPKRLTLDVEPGFLFYGACFCALGFWFFPILGYLFGKQPLAWVAAFCIPPPFFALAAALLRRRFEVTADEHGLRVRRSDRIVRFIAWENMTLVKYGETAIGFGGEYVHYQKSADFLDVRGRNPKGRIWLGTDFFSFDEETFYAISARVMEEAERRKVRVVRAKWGSFA